MGFGWQVFWFIIVAQFTLGTTSDEEYVSVRRWRYLGTFMFFAPIVYCWFNY